MARRKKQMLATATNEQPHKINKRLDAIIARLIGHMESARETFREYCKAALEEGMNPSESWDYISKRLKGVIPKRTLQNWGDTYLPLGSKRPYKRSHNGESAKWHFAEGNSYSGSEQSDEGENEGPVNDEDLGESAEIWQIKPEEYRIEEVERYDRQFLIKLVKYLHKKIEGRPKKEQ